MKMKTVNPVKNKVEKTSQFSSVEEKVEAIIKSVKQEFPDLASHDQANIIIQILSITIQT